MARPQSIRKIAVLSCVVSLIFILSFGSAGAWSLWGDEAPTEKEGSMPSFSLPSATTEGNVSSADFKGKVLLINFWATWCGPCVAEYPDLKKLHVDLQAKGFSVIGLSADSSVGIVERFVEQQGHKYPMAVMSGGKLMRQFEAGAGLPATFLIDRQGSIVKKYIGTRSYEEFRADIEKVL